MSVVANVAINVDSRGAVGQLKAVQQGAVATDKAFDKLNATTAAAEGKFKVAANGVKYFTDATGRARAENGRFLSSSERAAAGLQAQGRAAEQAAAKMRGLNGAIEQLQGAMAVAGPYIALAAGIAAAAGAALKFSNEIDRNRQQLTLFTKNVEATNAIIADLKTTADATSLGLPGLLEATKTLAAYGVTAKNAGTATKLLGDLALGDNEKLQRFAVNLGQISSIGRAYTVDLKQFAMAGIPIFEALAKVMGTSTGEVLRLAEQGKVTYPIVIKAINELTKEGASFYNGAEKGGTNLDRSLAQLQGSFESLQVVIGNAVGPTAVTGVTILKDALDGVLLVVKYLSNEFEYFSGLISKSDFGHTIINELKFVTKYLQENPDLMMALNPGTKVLGPIGEFLGPLGKIAQNQKKEDKKTGKKTDSTQLLNEANAIAEKNAITELANLRIENANKIAKLNKNTELQLKDNRLQYEQQIADFRVSTLRRIADMERDLEDQRVKANFDLQQAQLKLAGSRQFIGQTQDISRAIVSGKSPAEIQSLQTARDSAKTLNDAAVTRRQIEFDSTMKKIQLERTLTDFKRGIEREIGEMQKNYARQVAGILQTAGRTLSDLMVEGAKKAKEIMESAKPTDGAGGGTSKRGGMGKVIEYFSGDPKLGAAGGYRPDHGGSNYHDHIAYKTAKEAKEAAALLNRSGIKTTELKGVNPVGGHAPRSYHYSGQAFDVPGAQVPVGQEPALSARVRKILQIGAGGAAAKGPAAAAMQGPPGMRAMVPGAQSMQVDAANNIKPFSPATAKLDQQTKGLQQLQTQSEIAAKVALQDEYTKSLAESTGTVLQQSTANLNTAIQKNQLDQRTLDLIVSGTNPALAAQFAQNEQLVTQNKIILADQIKKIEGSLQELDLTTEQVNLRMQDVDLLNQQIAAGPQILENLNQQAIKQKEISDATAKLAAEKERVTSLVKGIGASIEGGIVSAIDGAITGAKSLQEVLSDVLKDIGKMLISFGVKTLLSSINPTIGGIKMFAAGGNPPVGRPSLVGEQGPELFVPRTSGTIVPADATAAAMARYQRKGSGSGAGESEMALAPSGGSAMQMRNGNTINNSTRISNGDQYNQNQANADNTNIVNNSTPVLSMSFETTRFMDRDWVDKDQLVAAMAATERRAAAAGAKAGAAQITSKLQQSPAYRRQVGLR